MKKVQSALHAPQFAPPEKIGIGFTYQSGLRPAVEAARGLIDFLVISPELLCRERADGDRRQFKLRKPLIDDALSACDGRPAVVHGLELSIGTVEGWEAPSAPFRGSASTGSWRSTWRVEPLTTAS
jgi:hypothetical protein